MEISHMRIPAPLFRLRKLRRDGCARTSAMPQAKPGAEVNSNGSGARLAGMT